MLLLLRNKLLIQSQDETLNTYLIIPGVGSRPTCKRKNLNKNKPLILIRKHVQSEIRRLPVLIEITDIKCFFELLLTSVSHLFHSPELPYGFQLRTCILHVMFRSNITSTSHEIHVEINHFLKGRLRVKTVNNNTKCRSNQYLKCLCGILTFFIHLRKHIEK